MIANRETFRRRVANRRPNEAGLTLIELLLSITLLAILAGFLAGGLSVGRRAFSADRVSADGSEKRAALQTLSDLIGSALPVRSTTPVAGMMFDGRQEALSFLALSEGRALAGGVYQIVLHRNGNELTADVTAWAVGSKQDGRGPPRTQVVLLRGVREVRLRYFGNPAAADARKWLSSWEHADRLPELVSIDIEFEDQPQNQPSTLITALRQG